jgi:hypothetical protein
MEKETTIKIRLPFKRVPAIEKDSLAYRIAPHLYRWQWLYSWGGGSVQEFGGSRVNTVRHLCLFRYHVLTIHRNEYHDLSDKERADEYLREWSKCEKELQMFRLAALGEDAAPEVKRVIRESLGVDLDEGTIK